MAKEQKQTYGLGATISSAIKTCFHLIHAVEVTAETIDNAAIIGNKYCDVYLQAQLRELEAELAEA
jgi:hypothetical protein